MLALRGFLAILKRDFLLELRRRETVVNMTLFAVLILFVSSYALVGRVEGNEAGPIFLWVAMLFAGTVGLSRAFQGEREGGALYGILAAPIDPAVLYLAKVAATWLYVLLMGLLLTAAYVVLFNFGLWDRLLLLVAVQAGFSLAYVAAGTVISAMTTALRAGELVLRLLVFPIMVPVLVASLKAGESIFPAAPPPDAGTPALVLVSLASLSAIYIASGVLLFPKVVEE
jgi:heme exporter protein B